MTSRGSSHTRYLIGMCRFMQIYKRIVRVLPSLVVCLLNEGRAYTESQGRPQ